MSGARGSERHPTTVEPKGDREIVVKRTFDAPARIVFEAWTKPELLRRWWVPKSAPVKLISCEADVRVGGSYRFVFDHEGNEVVFFGKYLEVVPNARLVWTNEESGEDGAVTTVTFEEKEGKTYLLLHELYPSKKARDAGLASGAYDGMGETFEQLDEVLVTLAAA